MTWVDDLAGRLGVEPLEPDEVSRLLAASRDVAHRVERKITPLSTFLLGVAVGTRVSGGMSRPDAFKETLDTLEGSLPPESDPG